MCAVLLGGKTQPKATEAEVTQAPPLWHPRSSTKVSYTVLVIYIHLLQFREGKMRCLPFDLKTEAELLHCIKPAF